MASERWELYHKYDWDAQVPPGERSGFVRTEYPPLRLLATSELPAMSAQDELRPPPIQRGDLVLLKLLARPTLDY
jgi:hypothetical protein